MKNIWFYIEYWKWEERNNDELDVLVGLGVNDIYGKWENLGKN